MFKGQINLDPHKFSLYLAHCYLSCYFSSGGLRKKEWKMLEVKERENEIGNETNDVCQSQTGRLYVFSCVKSPRAYFCTFLCHSSMPVVVLKALPIDMIKSVYRIRNFYADLWICYSEDLIKSGFYLFLKYFRLWFVKMVTTNFCNYF
jgi:hypothetical protein